MKFKKFGIPLASLLIAGSMLASGSSAADTTLIVAGSGGKLAKSIKKLYQDPFTAKTGIKVKSLATRNRASAIKAMMAAGKPIWDISSLNATEYATVSANGWLEKIDWKKLDPDNNIPAIARRSDGIVSASWSTVLAVRTDKLPAGKEMKSWADFWDVKKFPGPRALNNQPRDNLEFALLADGVALSDIYKVLQTKKGVDRAFSKLSQIKPHIVTWWKAGAQPIQMLNDGEVHYTSAYNGRVTKLASGGTPVKIVWNGGAMHLSYNGILKGSKNVDAAHKYLNFTSTNPERSAAQVKIFPYPGFVKGLYDYLPASLGPDLPTFPANAKVQVKIDSKFWSANREVLRERWEAWLLD